MRTHVELTLAADETMTDTVTVLYPLNRLEVFQDADGQHWLVHQMQKSLIQKPDWEELRGILLHGRG